MTARALALTLALTFTGASSLAQAPQMGSWKLNEAQSKIPPNSVKNTLVTYSMAGDSIKVTTEGTGASGQPEHTEWTGKFDGKDYPLTGSSGSDARAYTKVNDRTVTLSNKKAGKEVSTGRVVVSADGKSRVLTLNSTDASGQKVFSTAIYNKE